MSDNVVSLPNWKKDASAYERLSELALLARECPDKFTDFCVVYKEVTKDGTWKIRTIGPDASDTGQQMGLLQMGLQRIWEHSCK